MKVALVLALALPLLGGGVAEANRAYRAGEHRRAAELYTARLAGGDSSAAVRYNLGTALLRLGSWDQARAHLEAAAGMPAPRALDVRAHYNAGNADLEPVFRDNAPAEQREARLRRAIHHYRQALLLAPADLDAKWNLELAQKLLDEENPPPESGGSGGGGAEDQQPSAPGPQPQPAPSPSPQQAPAPQISRAEAERILAGAERLERATHRQLMERNRGQRRAVRDW
ncbi:MAG TPA: hypothetical protein VEW03_11905 [Longimicrobiaceae bacterium]|nr:hypothetical protein [Longimicrobiaceae bacterium]